MKLYQMLTKMNLMLDDESGALSHQYSTIVQYWSSSPLLIRSIEFTLLGQRNFRVKRESTELNQMTVSYLIDGGGCRWSSCGQPA